MKNNYLKSLIIIATLLSGSRAMAQNDTLKYSFAEAEKIFLENNLSLIAQRYNVQASQALIQQVKLWDNPTINTDQNLYDNTHQFFNHSNGNGEVYAVLSQVFKTAGKRGKLIRLAKDEAQIQQAAFDDLMRNLRYNLQLDFAQLANLNAQAKVYQYELTTGKTLISNIENSYKSGKTTTKDYIRLKALLFGVENDLVENNRDISTLETELKVMLRTKATVFILPVVTPSPDQDIKLDIPSLIAQAQQNRADYLSAQYVLANSQHNLDYQRALAVPDVTIGIDYDRTNSYAPNYYGLQIGLPLPVFNRNQGNIKMAKLDIQSKESALQENELRLENAVVYNVQQYQLAKELLVDKHLEFNDQYDKLFESLIKDYQSQKIGLVDLVDFFDSYKDTKLKLLQQQFSIQKAIADLNFTVGSTIIKP